MKFDKLPNTLVLRVFLRQYSVHCKRLSSCCHIPSQDGFDNSGITFCVCEIIALFFEKGLTGGTGPSMWFRELRLRTNDVRFRRHSHSLQEKLPGFGGSTNLSHHVPTEANESKD